MKVRKKLSQILSLIVTILLLVFAFNYISDIAQQADFESLSLNWFALIVALSLFALSYCFFAVNWLASARLLQRDAHTRQALVFFASQPYKYLPSSLFIFSSRALYGKKMGLTIKQASVAQVFENTSLFTANFVLFGVLYLAKLNLVYGITAIGILTIVVTYLATRQSIEFQLKGKRLTVDPSKLANMFMVAFIGWLVFGLAFVSLHWALGLQIEWLNVMAANTIAFSLGMLAIIAPGGIGVREVVYSYFMISSAAIIYWRILVFIVDMLVGGIAMLYLKTKPKQQIV
jgi:glycosyltransferase 2 family protein